MAKKTQRAEEYLEIDLQVTEFSARVAASINYQVRDTRFYEPDAMVHLFESSIVLRATALGPEDWANEPFVVELFGRELMAGDFSRTAEDCRAKDKNGQFIYGRGRREHIPKLDVPKGIGHLERNRALGYWNSWLWVSEQTVSNMLLLLPHVEPSYISLHLQGLGRKKWSVLGCDFQTSDPNEE